MKTLRIVLFFIALGLQHSQAQINLVPNPSFEIYDTCPDFTGQSYRATGWFRGRESPDYFNECDTIGNIGSDRVGIPYNHFGYQIAYDGNAYMGVAYYSGSNIPPDDYREYLCCKLNSTMIIGEKYYISFMVSLTDGIPSSFPFRYACDNLGILFSMDSIKINLPQNYPAIPNHAHLKSSAIITDTSNWVKVCGEFIADSAYNFINLGNFYSDTLTLALNYFNTGTYNVAYYYIDNIIVTKDSNICSLASIYNTEDNLSSISIFPNPASFFVKIRSKDMLQKAYLFDSMGKCIYYDEYLEPLYELNIPLYHLSTGSYFLRLLTPEGSFYQRLIKN